MIYFYNLKNFTLKNIKLFCRLFIKAGKHDKKLIVENFKSIKRLNLELAPLTIFVGPNGSGKSSILEALALMSQSFDKLSILDGSKGPLIEIEDVEALFLKRNTRQ